VFERKEEERTCVRKKGGKETSGIRLFKQFLRSDCRARAFLTRSCEERRRVSEIDGKMGREERNGDEHDGARRALAEKVEERCDVKATLSHRVRLDSSATRGNDGQLERWKKEKKRLRTWDLRT
jgi:hypothetical protein